MIDLSYFLGKKIVIPGGNGFFGTHIIELLKKIECEIFVPQTKDGLDFRRLADCISYLSITKPSIVYGEALKKQYNFNSIHLVMANMYGPGEHFNPEQSKALAGLMKKIYEAKKQNKQSVEIWGTGKPVRDWLYVKDGVEGILFA